MSAISLQQDSEYKNKAKYGTEWVALKVLSLGGKWAYGVGIIRDKAGEEKVRIVKGKLTTSLKKNLAEAVTIDLAQDPSPISQVQKMNFKRHQEFTVMTALIAEMFKTLAAREAAKETPPEE